MKEIFEFVLEILGIALSAYIISLFIWDLVCFGYKRRTSRYSKYLVYFVLWFGSQILLLYLFNTYEMKPLLFILPQMSLVTLYLRSKMQ